MARPLRVALALAAIVPVVIASGCGGSDSSSADSTTTQAAPTTAPATTAPATTAPATTAPSAGAGAKIAVAADPGGALAFVQKSLTAPAGSDTFDFTNDSAVPHNFTIEKQGTEDEIGATKTITSSTDSLTVDLPAGTYTYYCSVPGHEAAGMTGTLTVE